MIPYVLIRIFSMLIVFVVAMGLLYVPIEILRRERSIFCDTCVDYWLAAFILASLNVAFGYYIQILLMVLFYAGAWNSKKGMFKFFRYLTMFGLIASIAGGCSLFMADSPSNTCNVCVWSSLTSISILVIFVLNFALVVGRFCWLCWNRNKSTQEKIPLKTKKSKIKIIN
eukprot:UN10745